MATYIIPTSSNAHFTQTTTLDGVPFILRFAYNQSEGCYHLSLQNPTTGADVISGIKVVANYPLLQRYAGIGGLPAGELVAVSNTTDDSPPGLGELGENARVTLAYIDAAGLGVS